MLRFFVLLFMMSGFLSIAQKIKGMSFVAAPIKINSTHVKPMVDIGVKWVAIMPYGFIQKNTIVFNSNFQWYGEKKQGVKEMIDLCKEQGLKAMLKPQVWIPNGYTGDFECESEKDWLVFEKSYSEFILTFVKVAAENNVEMFCIGTEWEKFASKRIPYWKGLIKAIRTIYSGKLVYAANWDEYDKVSFWKELDYIGIDAYFPLATSVNTTQKELDESWSSKSSELNKFSKQMNKKIIFTEIGYRSIAECVTKPWESSVNSPYNPKAQLMAYTALFNNVWNEVWFGGLFLWKWHHNDTEIDDSQNKRFTPQGKPAEQFVREFWAINE